MKYQWHGRSSTPEYTAWGHMKARCQQKTHPNYANYGGRGITVCERWQKFLPFYEDMGPRPSERHSLDRIDNEQGYSKENCRWATRNQQVRNRRTNVLVTINGETMCLTDWAEAYGIKANTIVTRINKYGWDPVEAIVTPAKALNQ